MRSTILIHRLGCVLSALICNVALLASEPTESFISNTLPDKWEDASEFDNAETRLNTQWWKTFDDPLLDSIVSQGQQYNYNALSALRRIEIARLTMKSVESGYYPSLGLSAGYTKSQTSGRMYGSAGRATDVSYFNAGLNMSWEIDLFGRVKAQTAQKRSQWQASKAEYDATMLALEAEIVSEYIQIRSWQEELAVANAHISRQYKVVKLTEARKEAGLASALDVAQAYTVYNSTKASVPMLVNSIRTAINALAVLVGLYPDQLRASMIGNGTLPSHMQIVALGAPMELLRNRPDVREAELQIQSQLAAVGIAKKDYLPSLSLQGSIGTAAHSIDDLFGKESFTYSIAPTLSWTIFDGLQRKYGVAIAKEQLQAVIDNYNFTLMTAVEEVDNAISSYLAAVAHIATIDEVLTQSEKTLDLSIDLYKRGLNPFTDVVQSQMTFLQYQDQRVQAQAQALTYLVQLYKALGGGYSY